MKYLGFALAACFMAVLSAFVFTNLWFWFLLPLGFPAITYLHGYGIMITLNFIRSNPNKVENISYTIFESVFRSIVCLVIGYAIHFFM